MKKKNIDLSDIKENELEDVSSFTDIMSRSERKKEELEKDDIEEMVDEKKRNTRDLTLELKELKKEQQKEDVKNEDINNTQILELTRQMKFNFEETKKENTRNKKNGISILNIIGEVNLLCIGYYIYLLVFTNYQDNKSNYTISGIIVISLVLLFGISVITNKKVSKFFNILNILAIIVFILFNAYTLVK